MSAPTTTDIGGVEITTSGVPVGVIIAIAVVVVLIFLGAIGLTVFCCLRRRRLRRNMQPYRPGIQSANPSSTPLIEMQQSGVTNTRPLIISHPESSPPSTPPTQKYDTSQMQQQIFEAPGNDEHPPDLAFAQQAIHGSLFPDHEGKPEPAPPAFLPVSPVSAPASPAPSYASPVSPLLTASTPRPAFQPRPSRMNPANGGLSQPQLNPQYHEPQPIIFEAPDTSVPRPVAELG